MDVKEVSDTNANPKARAQTAAIQENKDVTWRAANLNVEDWADPPFRSALVVFARFLRLFLPTATGTDASGVAATALGFNGGRSRLLLRSVEGLAGWLRATEL